MADQPSQTMPEDVRQAFSDAVRLFDRWMFDTPAPTLPVRTLDISLSGVCDLVLAYKNESLPLDVHHELLALIDDLHMRLKAELTIDPSYATDAMSGHIDPRSPSGSWDISSALKSGFGLATRFSGLH
jgi:hypothetical protein